VGDRYFDVIGLPLVAGRDFNSSDRPETPMVAIVDERVAASLGGSDRAVGQIVRLDETEAQVIGVARNAQYSSMTDPIYPFVYLDYWQQDGRGFASDSRTHVRVSGDAPAMMPALRAAIAAVDPSVPINEDYPLRERVKFGFQRVRLAMTILVGFGIFALVLSSIGVYGIVAFVASMRTREIAIRMALGADRTDVRGMIVRDGLWLAVPGALAGVVAAFGASRFLGSLLLGVDPHDPMVFASIPLLLITVAMIASYIPLRKATRIDPSVALRDE
jgi:ABC-type antimicrobial peptide transport system permease subunit